MKKIIYGIIITIIVVITGILIVKLNMDEKPANEECYSITGGGYNISFNTNSDIILEDISVCIACSPDSYLSIPVVTREGYEFMGWYYDSEFTSKVEGTSTLNVIPQPIYEKGNCITGYKNIILYAKWNKIDKQ